jgi:hypothetical protein
MEHYRAHRVYCSTTGHERISDTVDFSPKHCKVQGLSSADAATIAALDLINALTNPSPNTPFKQPGTDRMQEIKKLAAIFESMAPKRTPVNKLTEPTPKMSTQPTPRVPISTVRTPRVQARVTPDNNPYHTHVPARCSPRCHQQPPVTQEERAYQLIATPLPKINRAYAVTDVATCQQLEYRQLLQRPDLKPIWDRAFANDLGRLAQGVRDKRDRHHSFNPCIRNTKGKNSHLRTAGLRYTTAKSGAAQSKTYRWRRQDQLPGRNSHQKCRSHNIQVPVEQQYFDNRCTVQVRRCEKILPEHPAGPPIIHATRTHHYPSGDHRQIQIDGQRKKW